MPFPVSAYRGTVEVSESYDGLGVVVWTIDFESRPEDAAAVAELVRGAIAGMETALRPSGNTRPWVPRRSTRRVPLFLDYTMPSIIGGALIGAAIGYIEQP